MDSIYYAMCLDFRISPETFQQVENLIDRYSHKNFNFFVKPLPFGIAIIAEEFITPKVKLVSHQCFPTQEIELLASNEQLDSLVDHAIRHLIEEINQLKLVKI